jgi:hypothetical protein
MPSPETIIYAADTVLKKAAILLYNFPFFLPFPKANRII